MKIRKTYWAAFLSVVLSLSLALPYCCHADMPETPTHSQVLVSEAHQNQHHSGSDCKCGHELANDYQKNKKTASWTTLSTDFTNGFANYIFIQSDFSPILTSGDIDFRDLHWPSLHLLHSVFLN
jgi:hypothetical protein